ncbi:probable mannosyltransferase Ktr4p [[Candida] anglica]|uniref:Probable mannosyltransferase Ktr4p n=1 Tax=[Candida] anglica TaxID=148631 RepID=A0ABP0EJK2_9ASCO
MLPVRLSPKRIIAFLCTLIIFITVGLLTFHENIPETKFTEGFKSLTDKFDFSYLSKDQLDTHGYVIERGNVQFKFLDNSKKSALNWKSDAKESLKEYTKIYEEEMARKVDEPKDFDMESIRPPLPENLDTYERANATIIALVRNNEASHIGSSIRKFEKSFNGKFKYPYTFLNDRPFTKRFKESMKKYTKAPMEFVTIPAELWDKPESVDENKESEAMKIMTNNDVAYANKQSYHNMCRFYSGNFYNIPELAKYKYYWRVEPSVEFYSELNYDVFKYLAGTKKKYGFALNLYDIHETVATLWPETLKWLNEDDNYKYINPNGTFQWLLTDKVHPEATKKSHGYSTCHYWSNFEIADMDFFRSEPYNEWFKYLDSTGKFYYERWGDAPVHSMGLALFLDQSEIHWFKDVGYFHDPYFHCPKSDTNKGDCKVGKFSKWEHLENQNCMGAWLKYSKVDSVF